MTEFATSPGGFYIPEGAKPLIIGSSNNGVSTLLTYDEFMNNTIFWNFMDSRVNQLSKHMGYHEARNIAEREAEKVFIPAERGIASFTDGQDWAWYQFGTGTLEDRQWFVETFGASQESGGNFVPFSNGRLREEAKYMLDRKQLEDYCNAFLAKQGLQPRVPFVAMDPDEDPAFI